MTTQTARLHSQPPEQRRSVWGPITCPSDKSLGDARAAGVRTTAEESMT